MTAHWNGTSWTLVNTPSPAESFGYDDLYGVSGSSTSDGWAVGAYEGYETPYGSLVEHYSTQCIPNNCSMNFRDVQSSDYFYYPVLYLYCRGAISGYEDGTFRAGNTTTRAQLSKIVVLAEAWPLEYPRQSHCIDVSPWECYYPFVEKAFE